jgi:hypothetical protein
MWTVSAQPVGLRKCMIRLVITLFRKRRFSGGLGGVGTIFIPGLAEVKDLTTNMALKLIAKGGFEKPWLPRKK